MTGREGYQHASHYLQNVIVSDLQKNHFVQANTACCVVSCLYARVCLPYPQTVVYM